LDAHYAAGGVAYMAAFTLPHKAFQGCAELREAVARSWGKVLNGAPWVRAKGRFGLVGTVRALEVTHGRNGWHPHLHVLFFLRRDDPKMAAAFGRFLFKRWSRMIARAGFGKCTRQVWRFEKVRCPAQAGKYVVKWGAAGEIVYGTKKGGRTAGRSPFQILADLCDDEDQGRPLNPRDVALFREYAAAFKGARQLTWSRGLRELYAEDTEKTDAELAAAEDDRARLVCTICKLGFEEIRDRDLECTLLEYVERHGWCGVIAFSAAYGVALCYFLRSGRPKGRHRQGNHRDRQIEARV